MSITGVPEKTHLNLKRGSLLIGTLRETRMDFPWTFCAFDATEAFEAIRPLFDRELQMLDRDEMTEWERAYDQIAALGLTLVPQDGSGEVTEFLLHIAGEEAWFRY